MDEKFLLILKIVSEKLKDIPWVLGGSSSLYLQGIDVKPRDIDIITTKENAFKINEILKEFEINPVEFSETEKIRSYRGTFKIQDKEIDILGDFSEKINNNWINLAEKRLKTYTLVTMGDLKIPVTPLEQHLESYTFLNREKDLEKIEKIKKRMNDS